MTKAYLQAEEINNEFSTVDYLAPVAFTSVIFFLFSVIMVFGPFYIIEPDFILGANTLYQWD
jgi:hypothetical protein